MNDVFELDSRSFKVRRQILATFRTRGFHESHHTVYAIVSCQGRGEDIRWGSKNTPHGSHAEIKMLRFLGETLHRCAWESIQSIVMYISTSPCPSCSREIVFLTRTKLQPRAVTLDIVVAGLYEIGTSEANLYHNDENVRGLRDLVRARVRLRIFTDKDWFRLKSNVLRLKSSPFAGNLSVTNEDRAQKDTKLRKVLRTILQGGRYTDVFMTSY